MRTLSNQTDGCIKFVPRRNVKNPNNYIVFKHGHGCMSEVIIDKN